MRVVTCGRYMWQRAAAENAVSCRVDVVDMDVDRDENVLTNAAHWRNQTRTQNSSELRKFASRIRSGSRVRCMRVMSSVA